MFKLLTSSTVALLLLGSCTINHSNVTTTTFTKTNSENSSVESLEGDVHTLGLEKENKPVVKKPSTVEKTPSCLPPAAPLINLKPYDDSDLKKSKTDHEMIDVLVRQIIELRKQIKDHNDQLKEYNKKPKC